MMSDRINRADSDYVDIDAWNLPLGEAERDALLEYAASAVVQRGLETPAVFALEIHRPFAYLASQTLIALAPLFGPAVGAARMQQLARLLATPGAAEQLLRRIEEKAAR